MKDFDIIIKRVNWLLGNVYDIRYNYNMWAECYCIRVQRNDCDMKIRLDVYTRDLNNEMSVTVNFIALEIISGFSEIIENYDKYKKGY